VHDLAPIRAKDYRRREATKAEIAGMQEISGGGVPWAYDVFLCVAATSRGSKNKMSYFHTNARGEDAEAARALAALCLDHAPEHHHTVAGARTFAFLSADDGRTYFAAADPTPGGAEMVRFLERVHGSYDVAPQKRMRDEAVAPVVLQFAQALRALAGGSSRTAEAALPGTSPRARVPSTPLAPVCPAGACGEQDEEPGAQLRAVQQEEGAQPRRPSWCRSWRRHATIAIGVDVVVCLVLFAVWTGVCKVSHAMKNREGFCGAPVHL
jgi:hypothetical protein